MFEWLVPAAEVTHCGFSLTVYLRTRLSFLARPVDTPAFRTHSCYCTFSSDDLEAPELLLLSYAFYYVLRPRETCEY